MTRYNQARHKLIRLGVDWSFLPEQVMMKPMRRILAIRREVSSQLG